MSITRICSLCSLEKPIESFYVRRKTKEEGEIRRKDCKACAKVAKDRWYLNNYDRLLKESREKYAREPHKYRSSTLRWRYGINKEDYEQKLEKQNGVCAICKEPRLRNKDKFLAVDHCHTTGKFRGVLCTRCNTGIGLFRDNIVNLEAAIKYLKEHL